jgi:hypothetical protein
MEHPGMEELGPDSLPNNIPHGPKAQVIKPKMFKVPPLKMKNVESKVA